jgi:hypothetical protein
MAKEAFNGEYDDEAGMADNNLETMRRAVDGIDDVIGAGDNLPEWCQEKIAVAKSMLVTVWDYMRSEEEIGEGYNNYDNRTGFSKPKRDLSGEGEPEGMFMVMIDGRPWKEFTSNIAFARAKSIASKNPDRKVQVRWPTGQLNTVTEGVAEGSKDYCDACDSVITTRPHVCPGKEGVAEESKGLWANIHAKRERIKNGSDERMRKPGSKGAPTASALRKSAK